MVRRIVVLFFLVFLLPQALLAAQYEIKKGETVSLAVLKLTGSANYRRDGIKLLTNKGREILLAKFDFTKTQPSWVVVVEDKLAKNVLVTESKGKTLAQVCAGSSDPRCVRKVAKLNSITKRQILKPLASNVYALPGMVTALVSAPVSTPSPVVAKVETPQPASVPAASAQAVVPAPISKVVVPPLHPVSSESDSPPSLALSPPTAGLHTSSSSIQSGQSVTLTWTTSQAVSVLLNEHLVALNGSETVSPTVSTTYALKATNSAGDAVSTAVVAVNSPPNFSLLWLLLGIPILIAWLLYTRRKQRHELNEQTRLADIRLQNLRELKAGIQEFVSKFETFFKGYLNPNANTVEILPEYLPWNGRGVIRIVPQKGGYPNLTNHKVDLDCDLSKFNATFPDESFRFEEPFVDDKPGVCVPFVHAGGML